MLRLVVALAAVLGLARGQVYSRLAWDAVEEEAIRPLNLLHNCSLIGEKVKGATLRLACDINFQAFSWVVGRPDLAFGWSRLANFGSRMIPDLSVAHLQSSGAPIPEGKFRFEDNNMTLVIEDFQPDSDHGVYEMFATTVKDFRRDTVSIEERTTYRFFGVLDRYGEPEHFHLPNITEGWIGLPLTLRCSAEASPPITSLRWTKMPAGAKNATLSASGETVRFKELSFDDRGNYTCEARNGFGRGSATTYLIVYPTPPGIPCLDELKRNMMGPDPAEADAASP